MKSLPWHVRPSDSDEIQNLSKALAISPILARLLINRKINTVDKANSFLHANAEQIHDPFLLKDMDVAVERILQAIVQKEKICIYGDYDVDGSVATSLLVLFFEDIHIKVDFYIPNRLSEGYSLNESALKKLQEWGIQLLITVDNGIMANSEVSVAKTLGMDVIVTDHHQVGETLPDAVAVVNPQRKDCGYPFKGICGAGVAFKLMMALRQRLRTQGYFNNCPEPNLKSYLDLLCIPTVCDVVPLIDENRFFVKEGLKCLRATKRPGLQALLKVCSLDQEINSTDLGFRLGPRINACGRIDDAALGVKMLISKDLNQARELALRLDHLNLERREMEKIHTEDAFVKVAKEYDLSKTLGLVCYDETWHAGVVGIVASRLVEKFKRPVFLLCQNEKGEIKGSGRSIDSVSLIAALRDCSEHLLKFGGHEAAAGVTLTKEQLPHFKLAFDEAVKKQIAFVDLQKSISVDEILDWQHINFALMKELALLEPFGMGNSKPLFASSQLKVRSKRIVGEDHLKLEFVHNDQILEAIAFKKAQYFHKIEERANVLYGLEINKYLSKEKIQLVVKDFFLQKAD